MNRLGQILLGGGLVILVYAAAAAFTAWGCR